MSQLFHSSKPVRARLAGTPLQRWATRMKMRHGRKLAIALPYVWLVLFSCCRF